MTYGALLRPAATARIALADSSRTPSVNEATRSTMTPSTSTAVAAGARATAAACGVVVASTSNLREPRSTRRTDAARTDSAAARADAASATGRPSTATTRSPTRRPPAKSGDVCSSAVTVNTPRTFESLTSTTPRDGALPSAVATFERSSDTTPPYASAAFSSASAAATCCCVVSAEPRLRNASTASSTIGSGAA